MPSTIRRGSKRDSSNKAGLIKMELEKLLALTSSEDGEVVGIETPNSNKDNKTRKSTKIQYKQRADDSKDSNDDTRSKQSARSRRSRVSRTPSRSLKKIVDETNKNDEIERKSSRYSKSPKPDRNAKECRKIKYRSKEPDTAEERDCDARSHRSKESKGSICLRRSSHQKLRNKVGEKADKDGLRSRRGPHRRRTKSPNSAEDEDAKSFSFNDFESNEWSSSEDEGDIEVYLNDGLEGEFGLKDEEDQKRRSRSSGGVRKSHPRRHNSRDSNSMERCKTPQSNFPRSSSAGALEKRSSLSSWSHSRKGSSSAFDVDMILGDPSRRAPPTRSKSNDVSSTSRFQKRPSDHKTLPKKSDPDNFAEYLRKQGLTHKSDRSTSRTHDPSSHDSNGQEDDGNPFEVTYHQSHGVSDNWDPFASEDTAEATVDDTKERKENLRPTRSGGLLQTSSKDTISRLPVGARVRKATRSINNMVPMASTNGDTNNLGDREKQRRAHYKKSIAAAAMAGRRLSSIGSKPIQRQVRAVRSSFDESVRQLKGALQSAQ